MRRSNIHGFLLALLLMMFSVFILGGCDSGEKVIDMGLNLPELAWIRHRTFIGSHIYDYDGFICRPPAHNIYISAMLRGTLS